ncbi:MAG: glycoside hydrolase family 16 protein [Chitinophagaceae bacterium]|nr:glycoside hydrolase family 16 protein [Chitinophagaceae bacterium]
MTNNSTYRIVFEDDFNTPLLNLSNWLPFYLPQWSSRQASAPVYKIENSQLVLQITKEQQPWCPEFNGSVKCSSLQTGVFAGPLGSKLGQHGVFNKNCVVREEQIQQHTFLPQYGFIEIKAKGINTGSNVVSLWMIGYEDEPHRSAEICVFEIKGWNVQQESSVIGYGIHRFNDPKMEEAFFEDRFELNVMDFHVYAVEWQPGTTSFYIDGQKIKELPQAPDYPMQLMLGIYEVPEGEPDNSSYPKEFVIDWVRGYSSK